MNKVYDAATKQTTIIENNSDYQERFLEELGKQQRAYWREVDLGEAVNIEIRKKYSISEEFAILRQRDEKPEEYAEYFAYCEQCKDFVKRKKGLK